MSLVEKMSSKTGLHAAVVLATAGVPGAGQLETHLKCPPRRSPRQCPGLVCVLPREGRPAEETPVLMASPSIRDSRDVDQVLQSNRHLGAAQCRPQHRGDRKWSTSVSGR